MEILIGRAVSGGLNIRVDQKFNQVSREHAKVFFEKDELYIEDLHSANGTFVNGYQIFKSKIKISDKVLLGNKDKETGYILDVSKLINEIDKARRYIKIDYSEEFLIMNDIYENCEREIQKEKWRIQLRAKLPIVIISDLLFLIVWIGWIQTYEKFITPILGIMIAIVALFVFLIEIKVDFEDAINIIHKKYEDQYVCPRCLQRLDLGVPWRQYKKNGKCPHDCGATY